MTDRERQRQQHALEQHGKNFFHEEDHRDSHTLHEQVVKVLRGKYESHYPEPKLSDVLLVSHEHEDGDY
jgi:hypothetical protein